MKQFIGETDQVPPVFSAIKVNGKRAFDYARGGHDLELKARKIWIGAIEVLDFNMPELSIKITCGKGTYVRSLARDIGQSLGSGAYLTALRRTRVGDNKADNAFSIDDFEKEIEHL